MNEAGTNAHSDAIARCLVTLRWLVTVEILLCVIGMGLAFFDIHLLPPALQQFQREQVESASVIDIVTLCLAIPLLIFAIIGWVALFRGWRSGRMLRVILIVASVPIAFLQGPTVQSSLFSTIESLAALVGGVILGFLYYSDIRHLYEKPGTEMPQPK